MRDRIPTDGEESRDGGTVVHDALWLSIACSGTPTEPTWNGHTQIVGVVRDFRTDAPVPGARVTVGDAATTTDAAGVYGLTVSAGHYSVVVNGQSIHDFDARMPFYRGDLFVPPFGCAGRYGTVVDRKTREPIAGAVVTAGGLATTTDSSGWFVLRAGCFEGPCTGSTTVLLISHAGYETTSSTVGRGFCTLERVDLDLARRNSVPR